MNPQDQTPAEEQPGTTADPIHPLAELTELKAKHTEMADAYLRAKAEVENIRRRSEEEVSKARKFAVEGFAEALLPVRDSLEAAIANPEAPAEKVLEGVHATLRQLDQAMARQKLLPIDPAVGDKFDPHQHQAIGVLPSDQEPNTILTVLQKGFALADRVLRPAMVMVSGPK